MSGVVWVGYGAATKRAVRLRVAHKRIRKSRAKPAEDRICIVCFITFQTKRNDALHCHNRCTVITYRRKIHRSNWLKDEDLIQLVNKLDPRIIIDGLRLARMERNSSTRAMMDLINEINPPQYQTVTDYLRKSQNLVDKKLDW